MRSPDNHYSLAACLMTMDRYQEALSELDAAARLDPERTLYRARREELVKLMKETNSRDRLRTGQCRDMYSRYFQPGRRVTYTEILGRN